MDCGSPVASPDIPTGTTMAPLAQLDRDSERIILELALRIVALRESEFERVWVAANKICGRTNLRRPPDMTFLAYSALIPTSATMRIGIWCSPRSMVR